MNKNHLYVIICLVICCLFASCKSDLDLTNVDKTAQVEMGLALPIGSIHATLGDFLRTDEVEGLYIDNGVFTFKDSMYLPKPYHEVNLTNLVSTSANIPMGIFDKIAEQYPGLPAIGGTIPGNGKQITIPFRIPLKLKGINQTATEERLDSARIDSARFSSTIMTDNFEGMRWDWIDSIVIYLGEQVTSSSNGEVTVYRKGDTHGSFGQPIPITLRNFTLCLMKNRNLNPQTEYYKYHGNTVDSCVFGADIRFTVPVGESFTINTNSSFSYKMGVEFIDYTAVWGFFSPSKFMHSEDIRDLGDSWGKLGFLQTSCLPFSDPFIRVGIETRIAGALMLDNCYIFAQNAEGKRTYAEFNGDTIVPRKEFDNYLDPFKTQPGEMSKDMHVDFDKQPQNGHIDKLFGAFPKELGYSFSVNFNFTRTPQIRLTPDDSIRINAVCTLPMQFNQGLYIDYTDTIDSINLNQYSIDSLVAGSKIIDSIKTTNVTLYMQASNTIPADIIGKLRCYDKNGNVIKDPENPSQDLLLVPTDSIVFVAPTFESVNGYPNMKAPGITTSTIQLTKKQLDKMTEVDHIIFTGIINDKSLDYAFKFNNFTIKLTDDSGLTIKIGLTTQASVLLNLNGDDKNNNNK